VPIAPGVEFIYETGADPALDFGSPQKRSEASKIVDRDCPDRSTAMARCWPVLRYWQIARTKVLEPVAAAISDRDVKPEGICEGSISKNSAYQTLHEKTRRSSLLMSAAIEFAGSTKGCL
jgi:hypothetical protein